MRLDFNFPIKDHEGKVLDQANSVLAMILENGNQTDERYLDKIESWSMSLRNEGQIDVDKIDMMELKKMVLASRFVFNLAKYQLKAYIQKSIEEAKGV